MREWFPRNCHACESAWSVRGILCTHCWERALRRPPGLIRFEGLTIRYLTEWVPDENRPLSLLIGEMKGARSADSWRLIAGRFFDRHYHGCLERSVLVPCPSRASSRGKIDVDHAAIFARQLSDVCGLETADLLLHASSRKQKTQGRKERKKRGFQLLEESFDARQHYVFIDDILTTGATAKAAAKALRRPEGIEVWCFAYRRLAAERGL